MMNNSVPPSPEEWCQYWQAKGFAWRTEPEMDRERRKDLAQQRAIGAGNPGTWSRTDSLRGLTGGVYWWRLFLILHRVSGASARGVACIGHRGTVPGTPRSLLFLCGSSLFLLPSGRQRARQNRKVWCRYETTSHLPAFLPVRRALEPAHLRADACCSQRSGAFRQDPRVCGPDGQ